MSNDYIQVSCSFHDEFESAAVRRIDCDIVFFEDNKEKTITSKIIDIKTIEKQEFMVLENGDMIRLDKVILFNGKSAEDKNYC